MKNNATPSPRPPAADPLAAQSFWESHRDRYGEGFRFTETRGALPGPPAFATVRVGVTGTPLHVASPFIGGNDNKLFVCLLTTLALLLRKYSGRNDLVVHSPPLQLPGQAPRAGGVVPLLLHVDAALTLKEQLNRTQDDVKACYRFQGSPGLPAATAGPGAYGSNVCIAYDRLHGGTPPETYDLLVRIVRTGAEVALEIRYNTAAFSAAFAARLAGHWQSVGHHFGGLDTPVGQVNVLTEAERRQLLEAFNDTDAPYPHEQTLNGLFEAQAARQPEAVALVHGERQLTYGQLNDKANQLAHYLRDTCGVRPGDLVGLRLDRSEWMVIALLGVLKAGAAYVPIDPGYPAERVAFLLEDTAVAVLLTDEAAGGALCLPGEWPRIAACGTHNPAARHGAADLAYVIYTSGSTGQPKGVMVPHRGVVNRLHWMHQTYGLSAGDVVLQKTPYVFDVSVWEFFATLGYGARLVLCPKEAIYEPEALVSLVHGNGVTYIHFVPSMYEAFLHGLPAARAAKLHSLRYVFCSGEALKAETVNRHYHLLGCPLHNLYGPTEASIEVSAYHVSPTDRVVPIGKPISNLRLYVLDADGHPAPVGVAGELCIGGVGVALGYLKRAELTAERFVANPFRPGERLYRTGDQARWLQDGNVEFLGRNDSQVKIRGYRVEPAEAEHVLGGHPLVAQAAVVALGEGEKYLVGYYSGEASPALVRSYLQERLPAYLVPAYLVPLESLPLTVNGKLDRKALPLPTDPAAEAGTAEQAAPRNELEGLVLEVWQGVLARPRLGIHDNFFAAGGDSIKAIQVAARMHQAGYKVEVKDVLRHVTVARLAEAATPVTGIIDQGPVTGDFPLPPIQAAFWTDAPPVDAHHYNQSVLLFRAEGLPREAVEAVFTHLLAHHDGLRTAYRRTGDGVVAHVREPGRAVPLREFDFAQLDDAPARMHDAMADLQESLNPEEGLLKLGLFRMPDGDHLLLVTHHLVVDWVSWRILLEDLQTLFGQYAEGAPLRLPAKTHAYQTWARRLAASAGEAEGEREYWTRMATQPVSPLPADRPGTNREGDAATVTFQLDAPSTATLLQRAQAAFGTDVAGVLLAALGESLYRTFGRDRVRIALENHGREPIGQDPPNVSRTVGWFTSVFPLVLPVRPGEDLARRVRRTGDLLKEVPRRGIGYGVLRYAPAAGDRAALHPSPQLVFNYLGQFDADVQHRYFTAVRTDVPHQVSRRRERMYPLEVTALVHRGVLEVSVGYSRAQYREETMRTLANHTGGVLGRIVRLAEAGPDQTPGDPAVEAAYPLSPMQEGILFHAWSQPGSSFYHIQAGYRVHGPVDPEAVAAAVQVLTERHPHLKTGFTYRQGEQPRQRVHPARRPDIRFIDGRGEGTPDAEDQRLQRHRAEALAQPFDLEGDILFRLRNRLRAGCNRTPTPCSCTLPRSAPRTSTGRWKTGPAWWPPWTGSVRSSRWGCRVSRTCRAPWTCAGRRACGRCLRCSKAPADLWA